MIDITSQNYDVLSRDLSIRPEKLEIFYFEAPLKQPRKNAFGVMTVRPALIVRLTDASGAQGLGEVFCNWPVFGGLHRARILSDLLSPLILRQTFRTPLHLFNTLTSMTNPIKVQCDEPGPFDQTIAGLDIAVWDCLARRNGVPLHQLLSGEDSDIPPPLPAYASALTTERLDDLIPRLRADNIMGYKLKVGFGLDKDVAGIQKLRALAGDDATIMTDANQCWSPWEAREAAKAFAPLGVAWLEEPLPATAPMESWKTLAAQSPVSIAAGENVRGLDKFIEFIGSGALSFIQPDVIKWGGLSYFPLIAAKARKMGARICPHYLGGGVGLLATAHVLAAGDADWFEMDVTENPLRHVLVTESAHVKDGYLNLPGGIGIGAELDLAQSGQYLFWSKELSKV